MSFTLPFASDYDRERRTADTYVGSIAQLMGQQGQTRANAALNSGKIWGGLAGSLGDIAGGTMEQIRKERIEAPMRQAELESRQAATEASKSAKLAHDFDLLAKKDAKEAADVLKSKEEMGQIGKYLYDLSAENPEEAANTLVKITESLGSADPFVSRTVNEFLQLASEDPSEARRLAHRLYAQSPSAMAASKAHQDSKSKILSVSPGASVIELGPDPTEYIPAPWENGKPAEAGPKTLFTAPSAPKPISEMEVKLGAAKGDPTYLKVLQEDEERKKRIAAAGKTGDEPFDIDSAVNSVTKSGGTLVGEVPQKLRSTVRAAAVAAGGIDGTGFVPDTEKDLDKFNFLMEYRSKMLRLNDLLRNPNVAKKVGFFMGRVTDWTKEMELPGADPEVIEAFDLMKDLSDTVLRQRSGQASAIKEADRIVGFSISPKKSLAANQQNLIGMINATHSVLSSIGAKTPWNSKQWSRGRVASPESKPSAAPSAAPKRVLNPATGVWEIPK